MLEKGRDCVRSSLSSRIGSGFEAARLVSLMLSACLDAGGRVVSDVTSKNQSRVDVEVGVGFSLIHQLTTGTHLHTVHTAIYLML